MYIKLAILSTFIAILWDRITPMPKFWLFEKLPFLDRKPFACVVCMSWWIGVIMALIFQLNLLDSILIPILATLITILILKLYTYE